MIKNLRNTCKMVIIILLCLVFVYTSNGDVCISNDVIKCNYTDNVDCTIYQNNSEIISQAISLCSAGSFSSFDIYFDSGLQSTTIIITLNLANNIRSIGINVDSSKLQPVNLIASQSHPYITSMSLYYLSIYNSDNLLDNFPKMTNIDVHYSYFDAGPKFSKLKELTRIYMDHYGLSNIIMDKEWVGGLSKLQRLTLSRCGIQNITTDAFENLNSLTFFNLGGNDLLELKPDVFRNLIELSRLDLNRNNYNIEIATDINNQNAFSPLRKLTLILLSYTTIIPFDAFTTLTLSSIQTLYLPRTSTGIVSSHPFQNLNKLIYIGFNDISLICNCSMQWASIVPKFGINIDGKCSESGNSVTNSSLYTECGLTESYQCFNKTVACKNTCINTPDSYICAACNVGYGLTQTETESTCNDIDECLENKSPCEQKCRNTLGSYQCYCDSGYSLSDDLISCTDIDECSKSSWNTCDQHVCVNKNGSYTCSCQLGYQIIVDGNRRSCKDIDECQDTNICTQRCVNNFGSYECECNDGFTLSPVESSQGEQSFICQDINECELNSNPCSQQCINTNGSYYCDCDEEYRVDPTNVSVCLAIYYQSYKSNGTFIGGTVFLVIIIIIMILLLLTSLSIIIYMCYNKRNTRGKFQELPDNNQNEVFELLSDKQADLSTPYYSASYYSEIAPETTYYYTPHLKINVSPNLENIEDLM